MAGDPTYQFLNSPAALGPFSAVGGMQRRRLLAPSMFTPAPNAPTSVPAYDPATDPNNPLNPNNTNSSFARGVVGTAKGLQRDYYGIKGTIEQAVGDQADADVAKAKAAAYNDDAEQLGPKINSLSQIHGVGDALSYAAGQAPGAIANLALVAAGAAAGGGVGDALLGAGAKTAAKAAAEAAAREAVEKTAGSAAAREAAGIAADQTPEAVAQVAADQARERVFAQAGKEASLGRRIGQVVGGATAMYPGAVTSNLAALDDPNSTDSDREKAGKALAGGAVTALILSAPYDLLLGVGGSTIAKRATRDISKSVREYLPRVARGAATQGAIMGGANALAAATTLATHKWVNNNVGVLTPEAFDQYLNAFAEGGVAGALLGGGKEAMHGIPLPQFDSKHLAKLRELGAAAAARFGKSGEPVDAAAETPDLHPRAVDLLQGLHSNLSNLEARQAVENAFATHYKDLHESFGQDPDSATTQLATRSFNQALDDAKSPEAKADIMSAYAKALGDNASATGESAASQFNEHLKGVQNDTDEVAQSAVSITPLDQRPTNNPVKMGSPLEDLLAAYIPHDHPLWAFPDAVKSMAGSAAKLFNDEPLTAKDNANLDLWSRIVGPEQVKVWREAGPQYAELTRTADHLDRGGEPDTAMAEAFRRAQPAPDEAASPEAELAARMAAHETADPSELGDVNAETRPVGMSETAAPVASTLAQRLDQTPIGTPEHAALQAQLRDQVDRQGALVTENRSSPKAAALWASKDPAKHANTVEIEPKQVGTTRDGQPVMRRQALQLDNLISKKLAEDPGIGAHAALLQVLAEIQAAGHVIDPKSITPGVYYTSADGSAERLTPRQAADIRRSLGSGEKPRLAAVPEPTPRTPTDQLAPTSAELPSVRENSLLRTVRAPVDDHPNAPLETTQERVLPHAADSMGSEATDSRVDSGELGPRQPPPGSPRAITSEGDVRGEAYGNARVTLRGSPYEDLVNRTRRQVEVLKTPAQRGQAKHAAGVEIGTRELEKERANGTISEKRFASEMKRLHDFSSGLSRKYLYDAANGKFDSAKYHETPADNPEIDRATLKDENKQYGAQDDRDEHDIAVGFKEASQPQGPHDHAKETRMLNAIAQRLGVPEISAVKPLGENNARKGGSYNPRSKAIYINPNLHGAERIEVLAHELGHHVINHEIGQALGIPAHEVSNLTEETLFGERDANGERSGGLLAKHAPELHKALMEDYNKWVSEQSDARAKASDVLASRKALFRGQGIESRSTGETVAELIQRGGDVGYLYSTHEWIADHIARALTQGEEGRGIIGKFFSKIAEKLKSAYAALFGTPDRAKYAAAPSVEAWVKQMFARTTSDVSAALERTVSHEEGIASIKAAMHAALGTGTEAGRQAFADFHKYQLRPTERRVLANALNRRVVERQVVARYGHDEALMQRLDDPQTRDATMAHLAYKMWARGELKLGPHPTEIMRSLKSALQRVLGVATGSDAALKLFDDIKSGAVKDGYDIRKRLVEGAHNPRLQMAFNVAAVMGRQYVYDPWRKYAFGAGENAEKAATPGISAIAATIKRHTGEAGEDPGLLPMVVRRRQNFYTAAAQAVAGLNKDQRTAVHQAMQYKADPAAINDPKVRAAVQAQRALFARIRDYAVKAGVPLGEIEHYYPVLMDAKAVKNDAAGFKALLSQPHFEKGIRDYFKNDAGEPSNAPISELIGKLHHYATGDDFGENAGLPHSAQELGARSTAEKRRVLDFIYKDGTPADIEKFVSYQEKNPERVLRSYVDSVVRRAESVRRFGVHGEKLQEMVDEARRQHASERDIQNVLDYVAAATGRYATDGSPFVRKVFDTIGKPEAGKKVNKALFGPKGQAVQDVLLAYQNVRVLPLALLSSLSDPMGIGVRYGGWKSLGDVHAYFKAFKDGLAAASGRESQAHLRGLADAIGMADDYINTEILSNGYGSEGMSGFARKLSDTMFKYNGMSWFTRGTRYMALALGQHFLLKHAADAEPGANGSARYLRELGVQASDIKPGEHGGVKLLNDIELAKASPEERAADERVRTALNRFVDEAVLRTDASQHPLFMNDPAFRLVTQYKQFTYAFGDQIIGRIMHELHYTNLHVLGPALAYLPITMAAEMLRGFAQYGPGGNPNQEAWTPAEYAAFIWQRSGLGGPRATQLVKGFQHESSGYAAFLPDPDLGPTEAQLEDFMRTAEGKRSAEKTAVESLPASTLYQHWGTN